MAFIVSSDILSIAPQASGSTYVYECHKDSGGEHYYITYLAAEGSDLHANLSAHAVNLNDTLANQG